MLTHFPRRHLFGFLAAGLLLALLPATAQARPQPVTPQPAADAVKPGLLPRYYRNITFNYVDELVNIARDASAGETGQPVATIDQISARGNMWDSRMHQLFGIRFDGLIRLEPGLHHFAANSNDGVRVYVGDTRIIDDPDVHPDRLSDPAPVRISTAGWYPLRIWYFQKRNTATLQFLWQPQGSEKFEVVPATVLGHLPPK